eukprot:50062-Eustigmatos_ZCMA.PRE.1
MWRQLKALDVEVRSTYAGEPKYRDKLAQKQNDLRVLRRDFNNAKARAEKQQLLMGGSRVSSSTIALNGCCG